MVCWVFVGLNATCYEDLTELTEIKTRDGANNDKPGWREFSRS